jgi:hypothetical protein
MQALYLFGTSILLLLLHSRAFLPKDRVGAQSLVAINPSTHSLFPSLALQDTWFLAILKVYFGLPLNCHRPLFQTYHLTRNLYVRRP